MTIILALTPEQVSTLQPLLDLRSASNVLVAGLHPNGRFWQLTVSMLPGERRDAIRAACSGELKLRRKKHANA